MEVILLEKVGRLGDLGDKVKVKPGFGRNFLIPYGKAVPATKANVEQFEARRAELEAAAAEKLQAAEARGEKLTELEATIEGVEIAKSEINLPEGTIRETGEYEIDIQLHPEVTRTITLKVVSQ